MASRWRLFWRRRPAGLWVVLLLVFSWLAWAPYILVGGRVGTALPVARAVALMRFEQLVGVPSGIYGLLSGPFWSGVYEFPHAVVLALFLPGMLVRRPSGFVVAAAVLAASILLMDSFWALFPVAPPWMVLGRGAMPVSGGVSDMASFPSFHVAFAVFVSYLLPRMGWYRWFMPVCVVLTGNHWVVDVVVGYMVGLGMVYAAVWLQGVQDALRSGVSVGVWRVRGAGERQGDGAYGAGGL
jgi:hypothetical protein